MFYYAKIKFNTKIDFRPAKIEIVDLRLCRIVHFVVTIFFLFISITTNIEVDANRILHDKPEPLSYLCLVHIVHNLIEALRKC